MQSAGLTTLLGIALATSSVVTAQQGLRITRIPGQLVLPAAPGSNLLLEVEAPAAATGVWLAAASDDELRVPLERAGGDRWQLNLADARIARLTRRADTAELRAFTDLDGRRLQSSAVTFRRAGLEPELARSCVFLRDRAEPRRLPAGGVELFRPAQVDRIEVATDAPLTVVMAQMDGTTRPLSRGTEPRAPHVLVLDDETRRAWQRAGRLELVLQRDRALATIATLAAVPERLEVPPEGAVFTVGQRRTAVVPGSRGHLRVRLDDITGGQVRLSVHTATGETLVAPRSVRERERVEFDLGGGPFTILVTRFRTRLFGEDEADLRVVASAALPPDRIAQLLARIEASPLRFVRNERQVDGAIAARHLRSKLSALPADPTVDAFIDEIASRSSTSGEPYEVVLADGTRQTMREWLRRQLAAIEQPEK